MKNQNPFEDVKKFVQLGDENLRQLKKKQKKAAFKPLYYNRQFKKMRRTI